MKRLIFFFLIGSLFFASDPETIGAAQQNPEKEKVHQGNLLFGRGDFQGALLQYQEALKGAAETVKAKIHYNLANTLTRLGRFEEAEKEYRETLRMDSKFEDGKYNLEVTLLAKEGIAGGALKPQAEIEGASEQLDGDILRLLQVLEQKEFGFPKGTPSSQTPPQPQSKQTGKDW